MPLLQVLAALTLNLSEFSGAEVHSLPVGGTVLDVQATGTVALTLSRPRSSLMLAYSPSFGLVDVTRDEQTILTHGAMVGYAWGTRRLRLRLGISGTLGRERYLALNRQSAVPAPVAPGAAPPNTDPEPVPQVAMSGDAGYVPLVQVVYAGALTSSFGLTYLASRRWTLSCGVEYLVAGGLEKSEEVLPKRHGPSAQLAAAHGLTRRDTLTTSLATAYLMVPTFGSRFITTTLLETWGHRLSARTESTFGAGLTHLRGRASERANYEDQFQAAGTAGIAHNRSLTGGATLALTGVATLETPYNPLLGVVQQQLSEAAGVAWHKARTSLALTGNASQSLPQSSASAARLVGVGGSVGYAVTPLVQFQLGASGSTQLLPTSAGGSIPAQWLVFAGVSLLAPTITL